MCHAKLRDNLYFFISRNDTAQLLVRKPLDLFDNPDEPYEYYALNKSWKKGINPEDMGPIINGFRCNTVNYHPELKLWVMICDIWFMDNKIKMRISTELTGPWSDEITIYEIPETTPGSPLWSESNFCYLARECIQHYDTTEHKMLITYDVNNTSFSELISNQELYVPRIIQIPILEYINLSK
jgi:hypothetical protein